MRTKINLRLLNSTSKHKTLIYYQNTYTIIFYCLFIKSDSEINTLVRIDTWYSREYATFSSLDLKFNTAVW